MLNEINPFEIFINELSHTPKHTQSEGDFNNFVGTWMSKMAKCLRKIQNNGWVFTDLEDPKQTTFFVLKITPKALTITHRKSSYKWNFELNLSTQILEKDGYPASPPEWESFFDILDSVTKKSQSDAIQVLTIK